MHTIRKQQNIYINQLTELKGEADKITIIVGDLKIPIERLSKQKINKEI